MANDDESKRVTAGSFGDVADAYLESRVHATGTDLAQLANWCREAANRREEEPVGGRGETTERRDPVVLDVATGAGHTAGAVAGNGVENVTERVAATVVAVDASSEMIATAVDAFDDVDGVVGDAETLPFVTDAFDAVCCRIAAHHFPNPEAFVAEVARVTRPHGVFAFEDNVAPEDPDLGRFINHVERLRDLTHVEAYSTAQWCEWLTDAGFAVEEVAHVQKTLDFETWTNTQSLSSTRRERVERALLDASPDAVTTFDVRSRDGSIRSFANLKVLIRARLPA